MKFNMDLVSGVSGWTSEVELDLLYQYASQVTGAIVEIGSWQGRSTIALAQGAKISGQKVYAIDTFHGGENTPELEKYFTKENPDNILQKFQVNIQRSGLEDYVIVKRGLSNEIIKQWTEPIGMIFIDGDHSYQAVKQDINDWMPFLEIGGIAAFHDYRPNPKQKNYETRKGVLMAVTESIVQSDCYEFIEFVGILYIARKIK